MGIIKVDFEGSGDGEREWPVLDEGVYPGKILEIKQGPSKQGKPMLTWRIQLDGQSGTLLYWTSLTKEALWNLKGILKNLGYTAEQLEGELDIDTDELVNREVAVKVAKEPHWEAEKAAQGTMVNNIAQGGIYDVSVLQDANSW